MREFEIHRIIEFEKVQYYTIKYCDNEVSEYVEFRNKVAKLIPVDSRCEDDLAEILAQMELIGKKFGATPKRFKPEGAAYALATHYPKHKNNDGIYGLRLYCLILNENCVILLNGGDKKEKKAMDCGNVSMHFSNANILAKVFKEYISSMTLVLNGKNMVNVLDEGLYQN